MHWILHIVLPQIGESSHRYAVNDAMICGPADRHYVDWNHIPLIVESRQLPRLSKCTYYYLRWYDNRLHKRSTNLEVDTKNSEFNRNKYLDEEKRKWEEECQDWTDIRKIIYIIYMQIYMICNSLIIILLIYLLCLYWTT